MPMAASSRRSPRRQLSELQIRATVRELTVDNKLPSGAAVRAALHRQYGARGGVVRIYRLLAAARVRVAPVPKPNELETLRRDLEAMTQRATRAEYREEAHQTRWAEELDRLRLKVQALEPLAEQARVALETCTLLRQQLRAAELRAAALEQQLMSIEKSEGET